MARERFLDGPGVSVDARRAAERRDVVLGALLGLCIAVSVLWTPITKLRTHTLGAWDHLSQLSPLTNVDPDAQPTNHTVLDPVRQMIPWALLARGEWRAGRVPLWNDFDGNGIPLLANEQSAVFSPFTLPFYVLPPSAAVLASAALKLAAAALGAFLFLRALQLGRAACAIGAIVYATAAFHQICLLHPHVGVTACLPFALLFVERQLRSFGGAARAVDVAGLALALAAMVLAGHPEMLALALLVVVGYVAWRLSSAAIRARASAATIARAAGTLLLSAALGGCIGAVQWLPFLEYLNHAAVATAGAREFPVFASADWPLILYPNLLGTALGDRIVGRLEPSPLVVGTFSVGALAVLLAASSLALVRDGRVLFLVGLGAAALARAFDVPGVRTALAPLFFLDALPVSLTNVLWLVGASVGTAAAVDALRRGATRVRIACLAVAALAIAAVFLFRERSFRSLAALARAGDAAMPSYVEAHVVATTALALVGLAALGVLLFSQRASVQCAGLSAVALCTLLGSTGPFRDFVPTVEDRFVLAARPGLRELARELDGERCVFVTSAGLAPNANALLGVRLVSSYDAIEIREYDTLRAVLFGESGYTGRTLFASRRALDLFGVRYVATYGDWLPLDTEFTRDTGDIASGWYLHGELGLPRKPRFVDLDEQAPAVVQRLTPSRDGFDALVVHFSALDVDPSARVSLELAAPAGAVLARRACALADLHRLPGDRLECTLEVPRQAHSAGTSYELSIARESGGAVRMFRAASAMTSEGEEDDERLAGWQLARDSRTLRGRVVLDLAYASDDFTRVGRFEGLTLHRYDAGAGRAWIVERAVLVADNDLARTAALDPQFDPRREVVLEGEAGPEGGGAALDAELDALDSTATRPRFRARCSAPAQLVVAQPFFPGWRARVAGREVALVRANSAFCAVALPAGESTVELEYRPWTFRVGASLALGGAAALLVLLARARRRAHSSGVSS